ncbi:hypothetical protein ACFSSC_02840 [Corynebacterium mendelii]|uniref:Uncharacterized protein n=1 Tax=Corynebacterium mendelii TaxID=2765362 RepID=A0A939DZN7_9CORY|nr:hypothetical protein [Corynebacterium mendelii]MBN9644214.1 hypothetical protein [Corynebacterium mendelii]
MDTTPPLVIRRSTGSLCRSRATVSFVLFAVAMACVSVVSWNVRAGAGHYQQAVLFGVSALSLGAIVLVLFAATLWWVRQRTPLAVIGDDRVTIARTGASIATDTIGAVRLWTQQYPGKTVHYAEFVPHAASHNRRLSVTIGKDNKGAIVTEANDRLTVEMPHGTRPAPEDLANQLRHRLPQATVTMIRP